MANLELILGIVGATLVLAAFALLEFNKLKNTDQAYDFLNLVGALLLSASASLGEAWAFLVLNLIWSAVALKDLLKSKRAS